MSSCKINSQVNISTRPVDAVRDAFLDYSPNTCNAGPNDFGYWIN